MTNTRLRPLAAALCLLIALALPALIVRAGAGSGRGRNIKLYLHERKEEITLGFEEYVARRTQGVIDRYGTLSDTGTVPGQAIRAIAVCVRSGVMLEDGKECSHTFCAGDDHSPPYVEEYGEEVRRAVSDTAGQILTLGGAIAPALIHGASHLVTESAFNLTGEEVPCLVSVSSPERTFSQIFDISFEKMSMVLSVNFGADLIENDVVPCFDNAGRLSDVRVGDTVIDGESFASALGLPSSCLTLVRSEKGFTLAVYGEGNGLGLSFAGACVMAKGGEDYASVLSHYFPGTSLEKISTFHE